MTIGFLKQLIVGLPDDMPIIVPVGSGFISACEAESGLCDMSLKGEQALVIMPCSCSDSMEVEIRANDFDKPSDN